MIENLSEVKLYTGVCTTEFLFHRGASKVQPMCDI